MWDSIFFHLENIWKDTRAFRYLHGVIFFVMAIGMAVPFWMGATVWDLMSEAALSRYQLPEQLIVAEYQDRISEAETSEIEAQQRQKLKKESEQIGISAFLSEEVQWKKWNGEPYVQGCSKNFWKLNGYQVLDGADPEKEWSGKGEPCYVCDNCDLLYRNGICPGDEIQIAGKSFTVAGILKAPKLYGSIAISYKALAALADGKEAQFQGLYRFFEPTAPEAVNGVLLEMDSVIGVLTGTEQEAVYLQSVERIAKERLTTGIAMLIFTMISLVSVNGGMLMQEQKQLAVRQAIGAKEKELFWEYALRMEVLYLLACAVNVPLYPILFGSMHGMSRELPLPVVGIVGIAGSAVWLFVTGILWERMIGKQALIPILKGDV